MSLQPDSFPAQPGAPCLDRFSFSAKGKWVGETDFSLLALGLPCQNWLYLRRIRLHMVKLRYVLAGFHPAEVSFEQIVLKAARFVII